MTYNDIIENIIRYKSIKKFLETRKTLVLTWYRQNIVQGEDFDTYDVVDIDYWESIDDYVVCFSENIVYVDPYISIPLKMFFMDIQGYPKYVEALKLVNHFSGEEALCEIRGNYRFQMLVKGKWCNVYGKGIEILKEVK